MIRPSPRYGGTERVPGALYQQNCVRFLSPPDTSSRTSPHQDALLHSMNSGPTIALLEQEGAMANGRRAASRLARSFSSALAAAMDIESIPRPRLDPRGPGLILACFISFFCMTGIAIPRASAATLVVDPQFGPYTTIQAAISMAAADDTVEVHPGLYPEQLRPLVPMTILGRDGAESTIVSGSGLQRILDLENVALVVHGLTFEDGHGEAEGGAVRCTNGTFAATECVFRGNRATNGNYDLALGGAIAFIGESWCSLVDCLFIKNEADNPRASYGGAVGIDGNWGNSRPPTDPTSGKNPITRYLLQNCSFISNRARATAAIWSNELVEIRNCVFVDKGSSIGTFVNATAPPALNCNIYLDLPSPQFGDRARRLDEEPQSDPRICPGTESTVHSSSPLWSDAGGCGRIGNLPVGCSGSDGPRDHPARRPAGRRPTNPRVWLRARGGPRRAAGRPAWRASPE